MRTHRRTLAVITAAVALTLLAACGSDKKASSSSASSSSSAATTTTAPPLDEAAAKEEITKMYQTFFNGNESDKETKAAQLAEADKLKALFDENFTKNAAVAAMTTVTVEEITINPDNKTADVVFTLNVGGTPALEHFGGSAVLQDGKWKMTTAGFCDITYIGATPPPECTS
jgi:hypothetical protein